MRSSHCSGSWRGASPRLISKLQSRRYVGRWASDALRLRRAHGTKCLVTAAPRGHLDAGVDLRSGSNTSTAHLPSNDSSHPVHYRFISPRRPPGRSHGVVRRLRRRSASHEPAVKRGDIADAVRPMTRRRYVRSHRGIPRRRAVVQRERPGHWSA